MPLRSWQLLQFSLLLKPQTEKLKRNNTDPNPNPKKLQNLKGTE